MAKCVLRRLSQCLRNHAGNEPLCHQLDRLASQLGPPFQLGEQLAWNPKACQHGSPTWSVIALRSR